MRKFFFALLLLPFASLGQDITVFREIENQRIVLYAKNVAHFPYSITLELSLTNYLFSEGQKKVFVIPPKSDRFKIGDLTKRNDKESSSYNYKYQSSIGDITIVRYDSLYEYDLPFHRGESYKVIQGYNGTFSHQDENAIDFAMPEGTKIVAAREGVVVRLVQNNTMSCPQKECAKYNNYITILHNDGTFGNYNHIKYNGSAVSLGDIVKKGSVIGYSGNVGWSSSPHLHFMVTVPAIGKWRSVETLFRTNSGDTKEILMQGNTYARNY